MYLYKTGRYTFSLPLMIGGLLAEQNVHTLELLEKLGEHMGIIFQLKDDEIGNPDIDERDVLLEVLDYSLVRTR